MAPLILLLASIGAYIGRGLVLDVVVMFIAGIVGFLLRRSGYSIPGIVLGIILGKIGEQNFAQGMQMVHYDLMAYLSRPDLLTADSGWCPHTRRRRLSGLSGSG